MKTRLLVIIGIVFGTIIPSLVYGLEIPMTADDVIENFDLIVLGTVTNVKNADGNPPEFQIDIEQVVKPQSFEGKTITAIGCDPNKNYRGTSCPSFEMGQRGLFLLSISGNEYVVSSLSSVSEPRCTIEQYLARYRGLVHDFFWTQDGQNDVFFTKKPVAIHYLLMNHDMKEKDYSLHLNAHTGNSVFSDVINGAMSHCTAFTEVTTSFVPTVMGTYGFDVKHNDGGRDFMDYPLLIMAQHR